MEKRLIISDEQPYVLHRRLQEALLLPPEKPLAVPDQPLFAPNVDAVLRDMKFIGVPHGVRSALVYAQGLRIEHSMGIPYIFFCNSHSYMVATETIDDADGGHYPPEHRCFVSAGCVIPRSPYCNARMRVCINGAISVHFEKFNVPIPNVKKVRTLQELLK